MNGNNDVGFASVTNYLVYHENMAIARQHYRVAAIQAEAPCLDLSGGVEHFTRIVLEAASGGAQVVGFPVSVTGSAILRLLI